MDKTQQLLDKAITTYEFDHWLEYKNNRNTTQKNIDKAKKEYTIDRLNKQNDKWKTVKTINKTDNQQPPDKIIHNNTCITSPKQIAQIANDFFITKIQEIRQQFTPPTVDPITILKRLKPRNNNTFKFPLITVRQTIDIIKNHLQTARDMMT